MLEAKHYLAHRHPMSEASTDMRGEADQHVALWGMPRLSVIMACYNGEQFIGRTIESVIAQSLTDWEMIIVDDGSTDASVDVVAGFARRDPRIHSVRQSNQYLSRARNNGFGHAAPDSEYLLFLDADDVIMPQAFQKMIAHLEQHPDAGAAYNLCLMIDAQDRPLSPDGAALAGALRFEPTLFGCIGVQRVPVGRFQSSIASLVSFHQAVPSCTYFRRSAFERAGGWDNTFGDRRVAFEDRDMIVRVALIAPVHMVAEAFTLYRRHSTNVSSTTVPAGNEYFFQLWQAKTFANKEQGDEVSRALIFDSYLAAHLTLTHSVDLLGQRQFRNGLYQLVHGLWKLRRPCLRLLYFAWRKVSGDRRKLREVRDGREST